MLASTYGSLASHVPSVIFLFVVYAACVVSVCRMSRRAPVREGSPPDPFSPGARRGVRLVQAPPRASRVAPTPREAEPTPPFDWNA